MRILIDGYNLIRAVPELSRLDREDLEAGRECLVAALAAYRAGRGHPVAVVFDGADAPGPSRGRTRGIPVAFSRSGQSADDLLAARCLAGEADLLVTSDAGLARRVGGAVEVVRSEEFWEKVERAAMADLKGEDPDEGQKGGIPTLPGRKLSKKERKALRLRTRL